MSKQSDRQSDGVSRCGWCGDDLLYMDYHDTEWGSPLHDERLLFEFLCLEGAQAGLSWITILKKRENYRAAFDNFNAQKMARYSDKRVSRLLTDPGIVRNRLKVNGFVKNARAYLAMREQGQSLDDYFWSYVDGQPIQNNFKHGSQVPANTPLSDQIARDLKKKGFTFVGSTIVYAFLQAAGLINDHTIDCFRHQQVKQEAAK